MKLKNTSLVVDIGLSSEGDNRSYKPNLKLRPVQKKRKVLDRKLADIHIRTKLFYAGRKKSYHF